MSRYVQVGDAQFERGTKNSRLITVAKTSYGSDLCLPVNIVAGDNEGPRLVLVFCQHGDEVSPLAGWYQLYNTLRPDEMSGEVVALPVANPVAYESRLRNSWIDALYGDHGNMNRSWPGDPGGWYSERLTSAIERHILTDCTCVIDFHDGTARGLEIFYGYLVKNLDGEFGEMMRKLSIGFGMDLLIGRSLTYRGTLSQHLTAKRILNIGVEVGYFYGFDGDRNAPLRTPEETTMTGILNVMKILGMIEGKPLLPRKQAVVEPETRVKPPTGGFLIPHVSGRDIGRVFRDDETLYELVDLSTMRPLQKVVGPYANNLLISAPGGALAVNLGDQGCHVANADTLEWITHGNEDRERSRVAAGR